MKKFFPPKRDFRSLAISHLLQAREIYHPHLAHLENVIATAIGLYRIRKKDPDANAPKVLKTLYERQGQIPRTSLRRKSVNTWNLQASIIIRPCSRALT